MLTAKAIASYGIMKKFKKIQTFVLSRATNVDLAMKANEKALPVVVGVLRTIFRLLIHDFVVTNGARQ